jgi:hypothetical protein
LTTCANEQETATQAAALKAAGCERIYREKASGGRWDLPDPRNTAGKSVRIRKRDLADSLTTRHRKGSILAYRAASFLLEEQSVASVASAARFNRPSHVTG